MTVFEVLDHTDEEQYFSLGVFSSLAEPAHLLSLCKEPRDIPQLDNERDEYCKIEIRRRELGWSGMGVKVYEREWSQQYDEEKDEYYWVGAPTFFPHKNETASSTQPPA